MAGMQQLPDTPWHVGYTKKDEYDPRRHKARCVHIGKDGYCYSRYSSYYAYKCGGSAHCNFYAETQEQAEEVDLAHVSIEEEARIRSESHRNKKHAEWVKMRGTLTKEEIRIRYSRNTECPICTGPLKGKYCPYCGFGDFDSTRYKKEKERPHRIDVLAVSPKKGSYDQYDSKKKGVKFDGRNASANSRTNKKSETGKKPQYSNDLGRTKSYTTETKKDKRTCSLCVKGKCQVHGMPCNGSDYEACLFYGSSH